MEDEASSSLDGRVLANLRVVDLKLELEKRGLSKSGSKKDLVKRLKQQLEFEKLCEEKKSGEFDRKIELDAATEQNEFVKQYLAQQQRRLEAQAQQKHGSEGEVSSENQEAFAKDDDSDSDIEDSDTDESSKNAESTETKDEIVPVTEIKYAPVAEICSPVNLKKTSNGSVIENVESNNLALPIIVKNVSPEPKYHEPDQMHENEEDQNNTHNLESVIEDNEAIKNIPLPSPNESEEENMQDSENISESHKQTCEDIASPSASVSVEEQTDNTAHEGNLSLDRLSGNASHENHHVTDTEENSSNLAHSSDLLDKTLVAPESNDLNTNIEDIKKESSEHASSQGSSSPKSLCEKDTIANMEPSECSSVPYSLSDIQLPESPGHHLKSKDLNNDENCNDTNNSSNVVDDKNSPSKLKVQSNGVSTVDNVDNENSNEVPASDSETQEDVKNSVSPEKTRERKESVDSRQTDESSEVESEKDVCQNKKSPKHEDSSSNIISDSKEEIVSKETVNKEQKSSKHHHQSYESDKSSDSDKYKHKRADPKHKTTVKHRKRNRQSRSQSSSSSSSRSSDSSPKRRHSKKSVNTNKSKSYVENDESNQMSDKNSDEKIDKQTVQKSLTESTSIHSGESSKKRLKIKRDNVVLEVNTPIIESTESTSSKAVEPSNSDVTSISEKQPKEETTEIKLSISDLPYVPRKVSLSNRKLNRKSSEDKSIEPKLKKSKWESFAACQKASRTISISTDSLKNWFPDFKLTIEPSSTMELEPEEHSAPVTDEKSSNIMHTDVSYRNDANLKQDSVSQQEMEDSESQEPNFEDSTEQGPVSKIIFIQNLVRPFTLGQLKDLLKQNGSIVEEYFWIDKIKSKCFVMYETEKEAIKAKNALHNARWPLSNPKILTVEFSNFEELELHKKGNEAPPKPVIETPVVEIPEEIEPRSSYSGEENKRKDRERRKEKERSKGMPPVREWDKDKVLQDSPEREHIPKEEKSRSSDKKKESKKRPNEDTPAKLLDDLFQKTKNPPCIYWLPLTEEQAKEKEEAQKMRKLEREKRNQQLKEQEEAERRSKRARSSRRSREKENRKSSTRSRSPVSRRR